MQVSIEETGALERRLKVQVPASEVQQQIDARLREIGKQVRIKGFRPGRIPFSVLRQRYGGQVRKEVVAKTVQETLAEAIQQQELRPVTQPRLDQAPDPSSDGDLEYVATVEIFPELETIDVAALQLTRPDAEVTEEDVDEMVETLREQRREWKPVERAPREGDQVLIEYVAELDSGRVPAAGHHRLALVLGESGFDALESALDGMQPGEEKGVDLEFPEGYREEELAGKSGKVELKLVEVQEGVLPEVDEAFVRSFGLESGEVDELRSEVRANLERELRQASISYNKLQLLQALVTEHPDLEVPESLVQREAATLQSRAARNAPEGQQAPGPEAFMDEARQRVKGGMLISEIAMQNGIHLDGARVRSAIETLASTYEQPAEVMQMYYNDQRLLQAVENAVLEEQVVDWVMDHAKVTPEPMKFRDVIAHASRKG